MEYVIKYKKNKGYCYDNRHLFSELRKEIKPLMDSGEFPKMTTIELHKFIEEVNKAMADKLVEKQELEIPYIGKLVAVEKERYYNPETKHTNLPILWGKTRQMKRDNQLGKGQHIYDINALKLVRIKFYHKKHPQAAIFKFRVCQAANTRLIHHVTDNSIKLFKDKCYDKGN